MLFEQLLQRHLGEFGRYQKIMFALACLVLLPGSWYNLGIVFLAGVPDHRCAIPELDTTGIPENLIQNFSIPYTTDGFSQCSMYDRNYSAYVVNKTDLTADEMEAWIAANSSAPVVPCKDDWRYSKDVYTSTIVTKWNLICKKDVLRAMSTSVYMAGKLIGVITTGIFSDMCGRKPTFTVCLVVLTLSNICLAFSPNYTMFIIIRFTIGLFGSGIFTSMFVILLEMVGPSYRVHTGVALCYPWALGYMVYALIAYGLRDWFVLQLVTQVPTVLLFITILFIPESPRWLYAVDQPEKGDIILKKMAKWNKKELPEQLQIITKKHKTGYIWDILRTPRMRIRSFYIFYIWTVTSLVYYGLALGTSSMGGNDFVTFFIFGAVEVPAYVFSQVSLVYLGRRLPLAGTMTVGGVSLLCIILIPSELTSVTISLAMLGKFCISSSFAIIYVHTTEMYPTVVRQAALGSASFCSRIGGIAAPYIGLLSKFGEFVPLLLFGIISLLAAGLTLLLPETKDKDLPETLEDGENFGRKALQGFSGKELVLVSEINCDTPLTTREEDTTQIQNV